MREAALRANWMWRLQQGRRAFPMRPTKRFFKHDGGLIMIRPIRDHNQTIHLLMERVGHWRLPRPVRLWMIGATRCGDGWLWHALAIYLLLCA